MQGNRASFPAGVFQTFAYAYPTDRVSKAKDAEPQLDLSGPEGAASESSRGLVGKPKGPA